MPAIKGSWVSALPLPGAAHARTQAQELQWQPPHLPDLRVSTITPASIKTLQQAGAWAAVEPHSAAVTSMQVRYNMGAWP